MQHSHQDGITGAGSTEGLQIGFGSGFGVDGNRPVSGELELLVLLAEFEQPTGSREGSRALKEAGFDFSESKVTRLLRRLDERGYTERVGAKGRIPTAEGERIASMLRRGQVHTAALHEALNIRTVADLIDLLIARRAVETEAAALAAVNATEEQLRSLETHVQRHQTDLVANHPPRTGALKFHHLIGQASHNKPLIAFMNALLSDELDELESVLDIITGLFGTLRESLPEHEIIVDALINRDPDAARASMTRHLDRLINEARRYLEQTDHPRTIDELVSLVRY